MCTQIKSFVSVFCFIGIFFHQSVSFAESNFAARPVQHEGHSLFWQPKVEQLLYKLAKELRLKPRNQTAQENFARIASSPDLLVEQRWRVLAIEGLLEHIPNLREKVFHLTSRRNFLKDQLLSKGYDRGLIIYGLLDIKENFLSSVVTNVDHETSPIDDNDALRMIQKILSDEQKRLSDHIQFTQNQYSWLKAMDDRQQYFSPKNFNHLPDIISDEKPLEEDVVRINQDKPKAVIKIDRESPPSGKVDHGPDKNAENTNDLSKQLVDLSLRISETEIVLEEKIAEITDLEERLVDAEQRFMLEQRIIQEKNAEIEILQKALAGKNNSLSSSDLNQEISDNRDPNHEDENFDVLRLALVDAQESMELSRKTIQKKDAQITSLRYELMTQRLQEKNEQDQISRLLVEKERELGELNKILSNHKDKLGNSKHILKDDIASAKDAKLAELNGILEIYRGKFIDENRMAKQKAENIVLLEQQLAKLRSELGSQRGSAVRMRESLVFLRSQLGSIQSALIKLKEHFPNDEKKREDLKNQVERLQVKLEDIQDFFLENIDSSVRIQSQHTVN